jgi:hypothetical protein
LRFDAFDTMALQTPKSQEKNEGRHYFDYFLKITTEYKWTTKIFASNEKMANKYLETVDFRLNYKEYLRWCLLNFKLI